MAEYADNAYAVRQVGRFLNKVDMPKRIHSSLGYLTSAEFEEQWHRAHVQTLHEELQKLPWHLHTAVCFAIFKASPR